MGLIDALCEGLGEGSEYAALRRSLDLPDPAQALRDVVGFSIRFWSAEEHLHRSLYGLAEIDSAARAFVGRQTNERRADLRRLSRRVHDADRLRPGLSADDALALLLVMTSFAAFDELRRNARRTTAAIERDARRLAEALLRAA